jgi:hypothetical protein
MLGSTHGSVAALRQIAGARPRLALRSGTHAEHVIAFVVAAMVTPALAAERFEDPFAYCAAVGAVGAPDARYAGPTMPEAVAQGLRAALGMPESAPLEYFGRHAIWRCMAGKVYACTFGANLPCGAKADTSSSPTPAMTAFCRDNPGSDVIPMVVTGRATVYAWRCDGGAPAIERQVTAPDAHGFLAAIWHEIEAPPK